MTLNEYFEKNYYNAGTFSKETGLSRNTIIKILRGYGYHCKMPTKKIVFLGTKGNTDLRLLKDCVSENKSVGINIVD